MKRWTVLLVGLLLLLVWLPAAGAAPPDDGAVRNVVNLSTREIPQGVLKQLAAGELDEIPGARSSGRNWGRALTMVELRGKTNHFGRDVTTGSYIDYWATVPDVTVWIAEHPFTKDLDIRTDETGWWSMHVIKEAGVDLELSFVYEKDGWITTKSNAITVGDDDITDLAIQYIDPLYYQLAMKPYVQATWLGDTPFENAMVVTVGKSWSSMHDGRLPHGDPGALAVATPGARGRADLLQPAGHPGPDRDGDVGRWWCGVAEPAGRPDLPRDGREGRRDLQDRHLPRRCGGCRPRHRALHRLAAALGRGRQRLGPRPAVGPASSQSGRVGAPRSGGAPGREVDRKIDRKTRPNEPG
jgi:hypothetical protein